MDLIKDIIKNLSPKIEFLLVVGFAFGYFILGSIAFVLAPSSSTPVTENRLLSLIIYEPLILLGVFWFLKQRGWILSEFKLQPSPRTTGYGIILAICAYISCILVYTVASFIWPKFSKTITQTSLISNKITFETILAVSMINPLFEELLVVGYVLTALKQLKGATFAVNVSVGIRLLYHLYQGPLAVISIIPLGLIFAYWYAKRGQLWSVIIAHALFDFFALYAYQ